jgi:hypothetical protein
MQEGNIFFLYPDRFSKADISYMITGSVACTFYGEPRLTHDVDVILDLKPQEIAKFIEQFPENEFYVPPLEVIKEEVARPSKGHFNIIHHESGFKADIYLLGEDSLRRWGLERKREVKIGERILWLAPPEYVIVRKLDFYREGGAEKHLNDIRALLKVSPEMLNNLELEKLIEKYGLEEQWLKAKKGI